MHVYVYNGGCLLPHKEGFDNLTYIWEDYCKKEIKGKGHSFFYNTSDVKPCIGCGGCIKNGVCKRDLAMCHEEIKKCDAIVILSPIYFFSFGSRAKSFLDRLYSYNLEGKILTAITVSGSPMSSRFCGFDIIQDILKRTSEYCGTVYKEPLNIVTGDSKIDYPIGGLISEFVTRLVEGV